MTHLIKLEQLEPGNINCIHTFLCDSKNKDLVAISSIITNLYEIAESEREWGERKKHHIDVTIYPENANWNRSFLISSDDKVLHEYFLNLLYSLSFSLYLALKNRKLFLSEKKEHLAKLEYCLNTLENLYITLDTLAVLIYLICDLNKNIKNIYFSSLEKDLVSTSTYAKHFDLTLFKIDNVYPINMLKNMRNMRAHRPFLDWNDKGKIISDPNNLSKVKSVCDKNGLFNKNLHIFIEECFTKTTKILNKSLSGVFNTYKTRLKTPQASYAKWEEFLT